MVFCMNKVFICLFVVFSLLVTPVAYAAGVGCQGDGCQMSEQAKKHSTGEKQDNGKMADTQDHCCHQVSVNVDSNIAELMAVESEAFFTPRDDAPSSVVVGPPLEPPSHT